MSSDFMALGLRRVIEFGDAIVARKCKKPAEIVKAAGARERLWTGIRIYAFKPVLKLFCGLILKKRGWGGKAGIGESSAARQTRTA